MCFNSIGKGKIEIDKLKAKFQIKFQHPITFTIYGMEKFQQFSEIWSVNHTDLKQSVTQISLDVAYSTSSFTIDGTVLIENLGGTNMFDEPAGIGFSANGLKMA